MITKVSVQMRLCSAIKMSGQSQEFQSKLQSAQFAYISNDLVRANGLLSQMGMQEAPISAHAKTMPNNGELRVSVGQALASLARPSTPPQSFLVPSVRPPCSEDHIDHQRYGGVCQRCKRSFYRGSDIQG